MHIRLELRPGRPAAAHQPRRWRREVHDHIRALLIIGGAEKRSLGTVKMPLNVPGRVEELLKRSEPGLLEHVENTELRKALREMLETLARSYIETAAQKEARLAREPEQYKKIREHIARQRSAAPLGDAEDQEE